MPVEATKDRLLLTIPDLGDMEALEAFQATLHANADVRGVKTLSKHFSLYLRSQDIAEKHLDRVRRAAQVIAGVKTPAQRKYSKTRTLNSTAWSFFDKLSAEQLRMQCNLFGLDYDSYDTVDERINALVSKVVGSANGSAVE